MIFVTATDSKYYDYLLMQIASIKKYFNVVPTVYDLGLLEEQRKSLASIWGIVPLGLNWLRARQSQSIPVGFRV